jgi:hypothetical protein
VRLMKVALKAARVCIEEGELVCATKVLERAADYQEGVDNESRETEEGEDIHVGLRVDYYALRTLLVSELYRFP